MNEFIECRACKKTLKALKDNQYQRGYSYVYDQITKLPAKTNFYGGYVCSKACDYSVCLKMQNSMPGTGVMLRLVNPEYMKNWE